MDEKGFMIGHQQKAKRVFTRKYWESGKLIGSGQDGNREWITLLATICMDGSFLPPALIYPAETGNLQDVWLKDFHPESEESFFASSSSGWTSDDLALRCVERIFDPYTKQKAQRGREYRLLILDGHNSHINIQFLTWCEKHRIMVAIYPPHSTHRLQPLDVGIFSPLSNYYSQGLDFWIYRVQANIKFTKVDFWGIFYPAFQKAFRETTILQAWRQTGLQPWNPDIVIDKIKLIHESRPPSQSSSGSSALSDSEFRTLQRIYKKVVGKDLDKSGRRLLRTIEKIHTENTILRRKVENLEEAMKIRKAHEAQGKALFNDLPTNDEKKAIFFSPRKIQQRRDEKEAEHHQKEETERQKAEKKLEREHQKQEKAELAAKRKIEREERRRQAEQAKEEKKARRQERIAQQEADKQLQREINMVKTASQKTIRQEKTEKEVIALDSGDVVSAMADLKISRSGRHVKPPKHFHE